MQNALDLTVLVAPGAIVWVRALQQKTRVLTIVHHNEISTWVHTQHQEMARPPPTPHPIPIPINLNHRRNIHLVWIRNG